jgi:hypothetical protein
MSVFAGVPETAKECFRGMSETMLAADDESPQSWTSSMITRNHLQSALMFSWYVLCHNEGTSGSVPSTIIHIVAASSLWRLFGYSEVGGDWY